MPRKSYVKIYGGKEVLPHFVMQPSRRVQPMLLAGEGKAKVEWVRGRSLEQFIPSMLPKTAKRRLIDGLADIVMDHMLLGAAHGDLNPGNILVAAPLRRGKRQARISRPVAAVAGFRGGRLLMTKLPRSLRLTAIDYDYSKLLSGEGLDRVTYDYQSVMHGVVPKFARSLGEAEKLKKYFERRFLEKIGKKF